MTPTLLAEMHARLTFLLLRAGVDLPPNFDYVQLGRKELDQLIRVGVYHEQNQIRARAGGGESDEEVMEEEEE